MGNSKKLWGNKIFVVIAVVAIVWGVLLLCCFFLFAFEASDNNDSNNSRNQNRQDDSPPQFRAEEIEIAGAPDSIYNQELEFTQAEPADVLELELAQDTLLLLEEQGWNGEAPLPIDMADLGDDKLSDYRQRNDERAEGLTIPTSIESVFVGQESAREITSLIFTAREEFLEYLREKGVAEKYIQEIDQNGLPADPNRIKYFPQNDTNVDYSGVQGWRQDGLSVPDFSKLEMNLYAIDVYNYTRLLVDSGILGQKTGETERQVYQEYLPLGVRFLTYHEMTHALQRAVDHTNVPTDERGDKIAWFYAEKSMWKADPRYHRDWGSVSVSDSANHTISNESQAEGVAFEMISNIYDMSEIQKRLVWEHVFDRLKPAREDYNQIMNKFENDYPNYWIDTFGSDIADLARDDLAGKPYRQDIVAISSRLAALPAYGGYLHPMRPEHSDIFWEYLAD